MAIYGPKTKAYLGKFPNSELYVAHSSIVESVITSQGAEITMSASFCKKNRCVEPAAMLRGMANTQRKKLLRNKAMAAECIAIVPPHVEERLAKLIQEVKVYQSLVEVVGVDQMEWRVRSEWNGAIERLGVLSPIPNTPPNCCAFSRKGDGYLCYHGAAVILEKHGMVNMYKFISLRHSTESWREMYNDLVF